MWKLKSNVNSFSQQITTILLQQQLQHNNRGQSGPSCIFPGKAGDANNRSQSTQDDKLV